MLSVIRDAYFVECCHCWPYHHPAAAAARRPGPGGRGARPAVARGRAVRRRRARGGEKRRRSTVIKTAGMILPRSNLLIYSPVACKWGCGRHGLFVIRAVAVLPYARSLAGMQSSTGGNSTGPTQGASAQNSRTLATSRNMQIPRALFLSTCWG